MYIFKYFNTHVPYPERHGSIFILKNIRIKNHLSKTKVTIDLDDQN